VEEGEDAVVVVRDAMKMKRCYETTEDDKETKITSSLRKRIEPGEEDAGRITHASCVYVFCSVQRFKHFKEHRW